MRYSLIINGYEFGRYIPEGGVSITHVSRNEKSVVTMDGVRHTKKIEKRNFNVSLFDMPDNIFLYLCTFFYPNPALVQFTDFEQGIAIESLFYIDDPKHGVKRSIGDSSRIAGISFTLEEK